VSVVLDAGALVAVERGDRDIVALIKSERLNNRAPLTHGGVIGQVWRGGSARQANLARFLPGVDVHAIDDRFGRQAGVLLRIARREDVIDAAVVLLAADGDDILTSDPGDLADLARAAGRHVELIRV
jgi:hypothetical protein